MQQRWAMIDKATDVVRTICLWDGSDRWTPPGDCYIIQSDVAGAGDVYDKYQGSFTKITEE